MRIVSYQITRFCLLALLYGIAAGHLYGQWNRNESPLPAPTGMVNDFAEVIDPASEAALEKKLRDFKEKTNPQVEIAVVTIKTTGERPLFDYSLAVARGWKLGSKEDDNPSALLMVAIEDRKYFTQVSKDLEDELPDGLIGQLQRQNLIPAFRQANYAKGIDDTISAFIKTIEERASLPAASAEKEKKEEGSGSLAMICGVIICLVVVFIFLMIIFGRGNKGGKGGGDDRSRWGGGGFGGNTSDSGWAAPIIIGGGWGGGSSSGGSDWGSGDSWGGFGGGGDFGGGGAGGDW